MAGNSAFTIVHHTGWRAGLKNMLRAGFQHWWKTRTWWVQSLIWIAVVDLILVTIVSSASASGQGSVSKQELVMLYGVFGGMFTTVGVVILMQDAIVGEKLTGTAAWVLSKPISRSAFVLAKLIANAVGILVTSVLVPGIIAYFIITLGTGESLSPVRFLGGMGALFLFAMYFLTLTLMLGAFFNHRGPVIGIALAIILGQQFLLGLAMRISPVLPDFLPFQIVLPPQDTASVSLTGHIILGTTPDSWIPIYSSIVAALLFVLVAIWRFRREEF